MTFKKYRGYWIGVEPGTGKITVENDFGEDMSPFRELKNESDARALIDSVAAVNERALRTVLGHLGIDTNRPITVKH